MVIDSDPMTTLTQTRLGKPRCVDVDYASMPNRNLTREELAVANELLKDVHAWLASASTS